MTRSLSAALIVAASVSAAGLLVSPAFAADPDAPAKSAKASKTARHAKAAAPAPAASVALTEGQLDAAHRVLDGVADCEFGQKVKVERLAQPDGEFKITFGKAVYRMLPEETSTGAIRLVDKAAGVVWLQIPIKSMLLNERAGKRIVDMCMQAEQRAATSATLAASEAGAK